MGLAVGFSSGVEVMLLASANTVEAFYTSARVFVPFGLVAYNSPDCAIQLLQRMDNDPNTGVDLVIIEHEGGEAVYREALRRGLPALVLSEDSTPPWEMSLSDLVCCRDRTPLGVWEIIRVALPE